MTARDALIAHLESAGMRPRGDPSREVYRDRWFRIELGGLRIPVAPVGPFRGSVILHDLHHVLTGYGTDWRGEVAIAGWELGSGGCAGRVYMWLDRVSTFLFGLLAAPSTTLRAFRRGIAACNLYRLDADSVLEMEMEELKRRARV